MKEKITSTEEIFNGKLLHIVKHEVELPDGNTSIREVVQHPGAVAVVAVDDDHQVLLVRQFRLPADAILYEIPAGILEPGEKPEDCAARELREETGYRPLTLNAIGGMYTAPGYTTEFIHIFHATGYEEAPLEQDVDEFVEAQRIPMTEALAMIERGEIVDGKSMTGLLQVARILGI
ncbi:MAG: NUDIX hydrolase [Aggregatilineales bacterium]